MICAFDLKEIVHSTKNVSKVILSCDTELDKKIIGETLFGVHKLNISSYPNSKDYRNMDNDEIREYIEGYYEEVLSKLDPEDVVHEIRFSQFISDERTDSLAKRHIIAEWIELLTDEKVCESSQYIDENGNIKYILLQRPEFIGPILEEVIKNTKTTMRGFQSLKALYLFEKGEKLETLADELEEKNSGLDYCDYRANACYYRCLADDAEYEYKLNRASKRKKRSYQRVAK